MYEYTHIYPSFLRPYDQLFVQCNNAEKALGLQKNVKSVIY